METSEIKILILGNGSVGKTSLASRFTNDLFSDNEVRIMREPLSKIMNIEGLQIKFEIFHYIPLEDWAMRDAVLRSCDAVIVMYSVIAQSSFNDVPDLREQILRAEVTVPTTLVANKQDLDESRTITAEQGKILAEKFNMGFYEISAKTNHNVTDLMFDLARQVVQARSVKQKPKKSAKNKAGKDCKLN